MFRALRPVIATNLPQSPKSFLIPKTSEEIRYQPPSFKTCAVKLNERDKTREVQPCAQTSGSLVIRKIQTDRFRKLKERDESRKLKERDEIKKPDGQDEDQITQPVVRKIELLVVRKAKSGFFRKFQAATTIPPLLNLIFRNKHILLPQIRLQPPCKIQRLSYTRLYKGLRKKTEAELFYDQVRLKRARRKEDRQKKIRYRFSKKVREETFIELNQESTARDTEDRLLLVDLLEVWHQASEESDLDTK